MTPFLPSNQVPGSFRPIVYQQLQQQQNEQHHQLTGEKLVNSVISQNVPISTRKPYYTLSENVEQNLADLNNNNKKIQKYNAHVRPVPQIIQYIASTPSTSSLSEVNEQQQHQQPFVLRVKPIYKKIPKQRPQEHIEYNENIRPSVQITSTEPTRYQSHGSYLPSVK